MHALQHRRVAHLTSGACADPIRSRPGGADALKHVDASLGANASNTLAQSTASTQASHVGDGHGVTLSSPIARGADFRTCLRDWRLARCGDTLCATDLKESKTAGLRCCLDLLPRQSLCCLIGLASQVHQALHQPSCTPGHDRILDFPGTGISRAALVGRGNLPPSMNRPSSPLSALACLAALGAVAVVAVKRLLSSARRFRAQLPCAHDQRYVESLLSLCGRRWLPAPSIA